MKGGFNNPPNHREPVGAGDDAWASMKGGFNNPPNHTGTLLDLVEHRASMKGGFNNPPNPIRAAALGGVTARFNEGGVQ